MEILPKSKEYGFSSNIHILLKESDLEHEFRSRKCKEANVFTYWVNLNEACTAVSCELPIITVIFNNQVLGMVRQWQTAFYGKRFSQTDPHRKTNFVKLAEGFGLKGYHCENLAQFQEAFADALKQKGPTWIECMIDKDEKVLPMIPGGGDINDIIMK